ncbi:hypothetical protein ASPCAL13602 [Aspergillus calidoustus]|uniref:Zn(2)-C6 fungal-type domain-containing protein n=1 Tax=Aspergillus calidoustus TaxID=454130 RepID=A0A0U5GFH3_ASPCI|nr:hypothetical protein ASPCAL13602 [Aspergillus calidoustus]
MPSFDSGTAALRFTMEMEYTQDVSPGFLVPTPSFRYSPVPIASGDLSSKTPTPPAEPVLKASTPQPRTNRVKRPHTKSRGGCFNCKSRRIKCQETKPAAKPGGEPDTVSDTEILALGIATIWRTFVTESGGISSVNNAIHWRRSAVLAPLSHRRAAASSVWYPQLLPTIL